MPLLAKTNPEIVLQEHLLETLNYAKQIAQQQNLNAETRKAVEIASALHDIGKADASFQERLIKSIGATERVHLPPHALLGLPLISRLASKNTEEPIASLIVLAIASHHSPLSRSLYDSYDENLEFHPTEEDLDSIVNRICSELGLDGKNAHIGPFEAPKKSLARAKDVALNWNSGSAKWGRVKRDEFVTIQGILEQADWLASSGKHLTSLAFPEEIHPTPRPYQLKASGIEGNLFITLPTGTGKTETALNWAAGNSTPQQRVFYVLPTITTINSMYARLRAIWNNNGSVAFYHSYIDLFFDLEKRGADSRSVANDSELQFFKYFFNPVNVTTPDQLILALMNHKR